MEAGLVDSPKFGEALAKTMDRLDKIEAAGELLGYELAEVLVIAVFNKPYEDSELHPDAIESFVFVDGTTQIPYVKRGIISMARDLTVQYDDD